MAIDGLRAHTLQLLMTVVGLGDPPPPAAIDLFNRLLEQACRRQGPRSLVHKIPEQGSDVGRDDLILCTDQLLVGLRTSGDEHDRRAV